MDLQYNHKTLKHRFSIELNYLHTDVRCPVRMYKDFPQSADALP